MRIISTICLLLFFFNNYGQWTVLNSPKEGMIVQCIPYSMPEAKLSNNPTSTLPKFDSVINLNKKIKDTSKKDSQVLFTCGAGKSQSEPPLYVIDGIPFIDVNEIKNLDPNNIVSIDILKYSDLSTIFCNRTRRAIIIITTKSGNQRKLVIKDFLDGNPIPGATVSFISYDKKDTIMTEANDSGIVVIDKLKQSVNYEMCITAIGYKLLKQNFSNTGLKGAQNLLLEREIKMCTEVVIASGHSWGCGRNYSSVIINDRPTIKVLEGIEQNTEDLKDISNSSVTLFPNPLSRGKVLTLQKSFTYEAGVVIRITSLDGKLLTSVKGKTFNGLNQFVVPTNSKWSAGIYFVQLYANGKLVASDKLVIQ